MFHEFSLDSKQCHWFDRGESAHHRLRGRASTSKGVYRLSSETDVKLRTDPIFLLIFKASSVTRVS